METTLHPQPSHRSGGDDEYEEMTFEEYALEHITDENFEMLIVDWFLEAYGKKEAEDILKRVANHRASLIVECTRKMRDQDANVLTVS